MEQLPTLYGVIISFIYMPSEIINLIIIKPMHFLIERLL